MKFKLISVLAAGLVVSAPSFATTTVFDFEGIESSQSIGNFYSEGTFGGDALAVKNDEFSTWFENGLSDTVMQVVGTDATLNGVFVNSLSLNYGAVENTSVSIWSGLNGTGTVLATLNLAANQTSTCSENVAICHWDLASIGFNGYAQSITFGDAVNAAFFDNVTVNAVPVPAAVWLMMSALGGLGVLRRKKAA